MQTFLRAAALATLTAVSACQSSPESRLREQVQDPRVGDVYVVRFQPQGGPGQQYYFYRVAAVRPADIDLNPARQPVPDSTATTDAPHFFADKILTYTRAEALELLQEQPGDAQHTKLVQVRR